MAAPKKVDYERIEPDWRAGIKSPAQMAAEYTEQTGTSVSHAAIIKHFKKLGVPRDLGAKVRAKADAMVMEAMVTGKVSTVTTKRDAEIIGDSAVIVANVRLAHRSDIGRARTLTMGLLAELEAQSVDRELFAELAEMLDGAEGEGGAAVSDKMLDLFRAVTSLPGRTKTMKDLTDALTKLIGLEREAYNIAEAKKLDVAITTPTAVPPDANEASQVYHEAMG